MSYLDYDLGYETGYDTDPIQTSNNSTHGVAFSPEVPAVSYQMAPRIPASGVEQGAQVYDRVFRQVRRQQTGESQPAAASPDLAGDHQALQGVQQSEQPEGTLAGDPTQQFTPLERRTQTDRQTMEEFAGDNGYLARDPNGTDPGLGWDAGRRALFREQYTGSSRQELLDIVRDRSSGEVQQRMMNDYIDRMGRRVQGRYAPGAISFADARNVAAQAVRRVLPDITTFQAPPAGDRPTAQNSTSGRIIQEINTIPRGSTQTDQAIHRDAVGLARTEFAQSTRDIFRSVDRRHYGNNAAGNRRASTDAQRFLFHRGVQDSPAEIRNLAGMDPDLLTAQIRQFSQQIRGNEGMAQELDRQMGRSSVDRSQMNRRERFQWDQGERQIQAQREEGDRTRAAQREEGDLGRAHQIASAALTDHFQSQRDERENERRIAQTVLQNSLQGLSQMINQSLQQIQQQPWAMSQQMFQQTNQMLPRAADANAWFNNANGRGSGAAA